MYKNIINIILLLVTIVFSCVECDDNCCGDDWYYDHEMIMCKDDNNVTKAINLICPEHHQFVNFVVTDMEISEGGEYNVKISGIKTQLKAGTFCDGEISYDVDKSPQHNVLVTCGDDTPQYGDRALGYCMLVSAIFLLLTALVYIILPEMRDVSGKSIINFCTSFGLGLFILFIMKVFEYSSEDMALCAMRGFLVYFFMLAAFFWSNAISIQMLLMIRRPEVPDYGWKQFFWYALYAWGCPALLTVVMLFVNFLPGDHQKPGIGLNHCWFQGRVQQWVYMYSVMLVLLTVNFCIFIYITLQLKRLSFSSKHPKQLSLKYKSAMTFRLILVMGITWIFEMISSLVDKHIIWDILDFFNGLQGPLIFLVLVVLRRRVVKALHQRGYLNCLGGCVERHLAVGDDEADIVQDTTQIPLNR